jgi:hypothetical protein
MKLVSYEVQTALGRFERIGAVAHGTIVDLNSACAAYFAESQDASAARRQADALVPPDMIAYVSRDETLNVGDFFGSGPPAYSVGFEIDRWVKPGDLVECEIEGIGTLSNRIVRA